MLVTFHSKAAADFTMLGDVALTLIKMMGLSGTVPSALNPEDIPAALASLRAALESRAETPAEDDSVELSRRAFPLIAMLEASIEADAPVMWSE